VCLILNVGIMVLFTVMALSTDNKTHAYILAAAAIANFGLAVGHLPVIYFAGIKNWDFFGTITYPDLDPGDAAAAVEPRESHHKSDSDSEEKGFITHTEYSTLSLASR
jgi:hypothetical protein